MRQPTETQTQPNDRAVPQWTILKKRKTKRIFAMATKKNEQPNNAVTQRHSSDSANRTSTPNMDGGERAATAARDSTAVHAGHSQTQTNHSKMSLKATDVCWSVSAVVHVRSRIADLRRPRLSFDLPPLVKSNLCALRPTHASHR